MFNFLTQKKSGEMQSILDLISVDIKKMKITQMAIEKAIGMISHAIAKSEFVVQGEDGRKKDDLYWLLNVRPNLNETATDFWIEVVQKLLKESEAVICIIGNRFYLADSFDTDNSVTRNRIYRNVVISANGETMQLNKQFTSDQVIHLKAKNKKIYAFMKTVMSIHDDVVSAMENAIRLNSTPKFSFTIAGQMPVIRTLNPDGTERKLTMDEFKNNIKTMLESNKIEVIQLNNGMSLDKIAIDAAVTSEDIVKMSREIFEECAFAFDIPKSVFLGEITEKADSTNEFITYAVSWIVELIQDSLNAILVGKEDYLKGEKIWIDLTKFKHRDLVESAGNLDKLRAIGFSFDEIREAIGYEALNDDFGKERVITKNYTNDLGGGGIENDITRIFWSCGTVQAPR